MLLYAIAPVMTLGLLGAGVASAHGLFLGMGNLNPADAATRQQTMFSQQAQMLGVSVDDVKNAWAKGESLQDLAKEKGITQDQIEQRMQQAMKDQQQAVLKALVDKGVITQAQADQRAQFMSQHQANGKGPRGFGMGRGAGRGFGHGFPF